MDAPYYNTYFNRGGLDNTDPGSDVPMGPDPGIVRANQSTGFASTYGRGALKTPVGGPVKSTNGTYLSATSVNPDAPIVPQLSRFTSTNGTNVVPGVVRRQAYNEDVSQGMGVRPGAKPGMNAVDYYRSQGRGLAGTSPYTPNSRNAALMPYLQGGGQSGPPQGPSGPPGPPPGPISAFDNRMMGGMAGQGQATGPAAPMAR